MSIFDKGPTRTYIDRLRNDPRTRAMFDGWVAQACVEAEQRYPEDYWVDRRRAHLAAETALRLGMSFVLDNDGELTFWKGQCDRIMAAYGEMLNIKPPAFTIPKITSETDK